jgi:copper chaperone NosL
MLPFRSRLLLGAAAVLLLGMFAFPIWRVSLAAPQYPEGLGMEIRIRTITGLTPNDLGNINNLNHYIGMKRIVPEAIPELRYMPWIVGALIAVGLAGAVSGRRAIGMGFVVAFIVLAVAGMADFWWWEYDYGHNLDLENAIIKIPGMSYQPPLIGSRQLLNFTATSLPGLGAWFAFAAGALAVMAVWFGRRSGAGDAQQLTPSRAA